jgi:hypothetical protein
MLDGDAAWRAGVGEDRMVVILLVRPPRRNLEAV